eukprot:TRINITY_DN10386_c0_g1_i1.p3 TRINITY_DN10386_c0_g1~~TRINITY_DN10386_c0_g1_i1.p3  ORF type:complete len:72 (-),score=2.77 TRINITY_DN10386_c0_g1_i1:386-601(-)
MMTKIRFSKELFGVPSYGYGLYNYSNADSAITAARCLSFAIKPPWIAGLGLYPHADCNSSLHDGYSITPSV